MGALDLGEGGGRGEGNKKSRGGKKSGGEERGFDVLYEGEVVSGPVSSAGGEGARKGVEGGKRVVVARIQSRKECEEEFSEKKSGFLSSRRRFWRDHIAGGDRKD